MNKKRTLVIGDIHSGFRALQQIIKKAKVTVNDTLIFLGDYVDGWSTAVETINYLLELDKTFNCVFIRGNHDELCYDWLYKDVDNATWFKHGGTATKASYSMADKETLEAHMHFYENLSNYYLDTENRLFLHAGFTNLKGIDFEYFTKTFYWDRTLWELAKCLNPDLTKNDVNYPKRLSKYKEIYIGHTPISKLLSEVIPEIAGNVWNLDTGAAFKGPLSILDIETKEFWQSDPVHTLYPGEIGRN